MKQIAINYGKVLFLLGIDRQDIKQTEEIWNGSEPLREAMNSPVVSGEAKKHLIEKIFPEKMQPFLKVVSEHHEEALLKEIFQSYEECYDDSHNIRRGILYYVEKPDEEQLALIEKRLCSQLKCSEVTPVRNTASTVEMNMDLYFARLSASTRRYIASAIPSSKPVAPII
mgnify:CR=1 FL=1